jgi:hypothetical protein
MQRIATNCAKACSYMTGHVVFEIFGLQQLMLEEIISVKGVRREGGSRVKMTSAYDANWLAFIKMARTTFGPTPRPSEEKPSSRTIYGHFETKYGSIL